jgi:probable HAF family extracellular repeat protein
MVDLGTLGGTIGFANFLNSRGEVVGSSNLAGDLTHHPFLWSRGELKDLGTLGGHNGEAFWINDGGDIVGWANNPVPCSGCAEPGNQEYHAVLWRERRTRDLRTVKGDRCSVAFAINAPGQVVGASGICHGSLHAFFGRTAAPWLT